MRWSKWSDSLLTTSLRSTARQGFESNISLKEALENLRDDFHGQILAPGTENGDHQRTTRTG